MIAGSTAACSDLRYVAGFFSSGPVIFLESGEAPRSPDSKRSGRGVIAEPCEARSDSFCQELQDLPAKKGRKKFLVVSPLDLEYVRRVAKNINVFSSSDFPVARDSKTPGCDRIAGLLKKAGARAITVPPYFPVGLFNQLKKKGIRLSVAERSVFPGREIKTRQEINHIALAQKAACRAMDAAIAMIAGANITHAGTLKAGRQPLTSEDVRKRIDDSVRDFGCVCRGTIVACGAQAANPHERGWGALRAYEPIVIDIFPQHLESGYWGDLTRTVARGTPAPDIRRMYSSVREAHHRAVLNVKAGATTGKIHNIALELFKKDGFPTRERHGRQEGFIHSIGHGVGLDIHENPGVGLGESKLAANNVITIEPGLYYHGRAGIRIEDTVLVTRNACRVLVKYPYRFIL